MPERIRLSRAKGWRMPPNTVKVDRTTRWGNPFIVGEQGSAAECTYWFILLCGGFHCPVMGEPCWERQTAFSAAIVAEKQTGFPLLRGKNLACWCELGKPCHADVLLEIVNTPPGQRIRGNVDALMARYGYRIVTGRPVPIQ